MSKKKDRYTEMVEDLLPSPWEKLIEALVDGDLKKLLSPWAINITCTTCHLQGTFDGKDEQVEIVASSVETKQVVAVMVSTILQISCVRDFLRMLNIFSSWQKNSYRNYRVYGCVAYLAGAKPTIKYAEQEGLFLIRSLNGCTSMINKESFIPKIFTKALN